MKLTRHISRARATSGLMLLECLMYIALLGIVLGGATTAFYYCLGHSEALIGSTDNIASVVRTGERWRADVRAATGKITIQTNATNEVVQIPQGRRTISYRFEAGQVSRQFSASAPPLMLLGNVKTSQVEMDGRGGVRAWRWELELAPIRKETHLPLRFTFEAAQTKP
jgi:hypothetical protein